MYAERYFYDTTVGQDGDPWWARKWSLENLLALGGMRSMDAILAFQLDPEDRSDGLKLMIEAGLIVAFMVDGECAPVAEKHAELKQALVTGRLHPNQVEAAAVREVYIGEDDIRPFLCQTIHRIGNCRRFRELNIRFREHHFN